MNDPIKPPTLAEWERLTAELASWQREYRILEGHNEGNITRHHRDLAELREVKAALAELVELKRMKTEAESLLYYDTDSEGNRNSYQSVRPEDKQKFDALMSAYLSRKYGAWERAAELVKQMNAKRPPRDTIATLSVSFDGYDWEVLERVQRTLNPEDAAQVKDIVRRLDFALELRAEPKVGP